MIPYGRQEITQEDINDVIEVLKSEFLTQGPTISAFEDVVSDYCGVSYAVAVNSATSALHLACLALDLKAGDWLWTSPLTFVASANCGLYCGANIDFVDINPNTYNLCEKALQAKLEKACKLGRLPKVLVVVHLCGQSCDMEKIYSLSQDYGFKIIEDASHAIGGMYKDSKIGSCKYSDVTVFSFHPVKIITTGEGGMALTNQKNLAEKMALLRSHGITRDQSKMTHSADGPWYYQQICLGFNYRMTDFQAALGLSQMKRLDDYVAQRQRIAKRYDILLADLPLVTPFRLQENYSAFHLYVVRLKLNKINKTHLQVFEELRSSGVGVNLHYIPVHTQPFFLNFGFKNGDFPNAESYYSEAISIPMFHTMTNELQDQVVNIMSSVLTT